MAPELVAAPTEAVAARVSSWGDVLVSPRVKVRVAAITNSAPAIIVDSATPTHTASAIRRATPTPC